MAFDAFSAMAVPASRSDAIEHMKSLGLHVMKKEWAEAALGVGRVFSTSLRQTTLRLHNSQEEMTIPVQTCTTVLDVKSMLAAKLLISEDQMTFVCKQGCLFRLQRDWEQICSRVTVKGLSSFKPVPHEWPHPIAIIGAGYNGIKTGIVWLKDRSTNFVVFDRHTRVGGHCWITAANKCSRLQTDFASFQVRFGLDFAKEEETWPDKAQVLQHLQQVAEDYGLLPHCRFSAEVSRISVSSRQTDASRSFQLTLSKGADFACSGVISHPGSMAANRIESLPGEDSFGGQIGYALQDGIPYDHLADCQTVIVGNGASATESVRICCDHGASKVYVVTRRLNLPCPRMACWFVHQAAIPVSSLLFLNMFEPMYEVAGVGDPFKYESVEGSRTSEKVLISQRSGFGIGDLAFLACAWGKLDYVEDTVKRLTLHTVQLTSGRKLGDVRNVIKALGLVGDFGFDAMNNLKYLQGFWCNGDARRPVHVDAAGIHTSSFVTMSAGLASYINAHANKFFFDHPRELQRAEDGTSMLPVNKAEAERPCYVYDSKYAEMVGQILTSIFPKLSQLTPGVPKYKHDSMLKAHPLQRYLQLCREDWDHYQETWRQRGCQHAYMPYPYTEELVETWRKEHRADAGMRTLAATEGPGRSDEQEQDYQVQCRSWWSRNSMEANMVWSRSAKPSMKSTRAASAG